MMLSHSTINIYVQGKKLEKAIPSSILRFDKNEMIWEGEITPTLISKTYRIRINYKCGKKPVIRVISEILNRLENERLPHVYSDSRQELCLYYPKNNEWNSSMYISQTILLWTSEWLFFYEHWLITNEWLGGGIHPETNSKSKVKFSENIISKLMKKSQKPFQTI
jgi:hypothetical protein